MADVRKKKKAKEARRKHEKEKEITWRMWAKENRSDIELELESEDPTEVGDDMIFFEEEKSREVVVSSAERHDPMVASTDGEQVVERRGDVPMPRKHAVSTDTIGEREAK